MRISATGDILGLVDVQPTFMPGGELPVSGGDEIVTLINRLMQAFPRAFATQDWHPADHISFASQHPGHQAYETISLSYGPQVLWPDHAIAASSNAAIHSDIDQRKIEVVIRKGADRLLDSYSAFYENDRTTPTGLDGWLRQRGHSRLFLCGLATDFCVAWSAEDAVRHGYEVIVIEDACRGIALPAGAGLTTVDVACARLKEMGVRFVGSDAIT
jgi:nicotinamidase/pyrazinamidase